jgi:TRAP transporter TAXI family solute receptor
VSRLVGLVFAACLFAIGTSTGVLAADPNWPKSLTLGTASPGGVYYIYGEELAQILTEKLGIPVNPFPTQGSIQNVKLLDSGGAQLGLITMSTGLEGWNGTGDWTKGARFRNIRALFPMYDNPFQAVVLQRSRITTLAQLDGKHVGVGPRAGNGGTYAPGIFKIVGVSAEMNYGSYKDMGADLLAGHIDALLTLLGAPVPAIQDVDAKERVTFLSLTPEQMEAIRQEWPEFGPAKIAAGTYRLLDKDYITVGVPNFAIGRADLPDDLVYKLVKAVYENQPRLVKATSAASETLPQNVVKDTFLPFHPGAVRYYREIGISIPKALVTPTN